MEGKLAPPLRFLLPHKEIHASEASGGGTDGRGEGGIRLVLAEEPPDQRPDERAESGVGGKTSGGNRGGGKRAEKGSEKHAAGAGIWVHRRA